MDAVGLLRWLVMKTYNYMYTVKTSVSTKTHKHPENVRPKTHSVFTHPEMCYVCFPVDGLNIRFVINTFCQSLCVVS